MGANQNSPNDASVKIKQIAPSLVNAKDCLKLERILRKYFSWKMRSKIKKKKTVTVFADFFLSYINYDFTLVLFSYRIYSI